MMIFVGKKDKPEWVKASLDNYEKGHAQHADWTLALNPNEGHEIGKTQTLSSAHIAAAVALRLPAPTFSSDTVKPKKLLKATSWCGNAETHEVASNSLFQGNKNKAVWLLDETTAKAWQAYLQN